MVQRVQGHARPAPRQFRYLLPFRVQVCRVQSPLPCFPSTVLFIMASPFSPPGPIGQVPRLRRYYGDATPSCIAYRSLMVSLPGSRASLLRFVLSLARSRQTGGGLFGPGAFRCRRPLFRLSHADNKGLLRFPAGSSHTYAVLQDPGRIEMSSPLAAIPILPPHPTKRRLRQAHDFVANTRPQCSLSTLHEQRYRRPCKTGFRLAGSPLPGGSRTL